VNEFTLLFLKETGLTLLLLKELASAPVHVMLLMELANEPGHVTALI
jgi:hypothetical protein